MRIVVNGETMDYAGEPNALELLRSVGLEADSTVVELNGSVLERVSFEQAPLSEGDVVELVRFVGGG